MQNKNLIIGLIAIIVIIGIGYFIYLSEDETENLVTNEVTGEVVEIDLSAMAVDGPAVVRVSVVDNDEAVINIPSMGLPLCEARENIVDVSEIEIGDMVEVRGGVDEEGNIIPCEDESHYLRVVEM